MADPLADPTTIPKSALGTHSGGLEHFEVRSWVVAPVSDRRVIEEMFAADFARGGGKMVNKLVQLYPIGSAICEIADSDVSGVEGPDRGDLCS